MVELAIVLVIVGLLVSLGTGMIGPLTKRAKTCETKEIINSDVEAVIGYAARTDALPTTLTSLVRSENDSWGKPLAYIYSSNLTSSLCGRTGTNLSVDPDGAGPAAAVNNVAFIILSSAENYNNQTAGSQAAPAGTTIDTYAPLTPVDNYAGDFSRPADEYDDMLKWITLDELKIKCGCVGKELRILNSELPAAKSGNPYSIQVYAEGGVPYAAGGRYRWCVEASTTPPGMASVPAGALTADHTTFPEASWPQADSLTITGPFIPPSPPAAYNITVWVRDNNDPTGANDNMASGPFVLTVNSP